MSALFRFLFVSNDIHIARHVATCDAIDAFVDLEFMGKQERQGHLTTWKSRQSPQDVTRMREALPGNYLIVRVNPLHDGSRQEIDDVIARGADGVMLPMFHDRDTVSRFCDLVAGRAEAVPLFETAASVRAIPEIVPAVGLRRLHIGMNDLHLDLKRDFLFEPLADGFLEDPCAYLRARGTEFGIGGIARAGEGAVPPDVLLGEHVRLGSSCAILSQTFHRNAQTLEELCGSMDFAQEVAKLRSIYTAFLTADAESIERNRADTNNRIRAAAEAARKRKAAP